MLQCVFHFVLHLFPFFHLCPFVFFADFVCFVFSLLLFFLDELVVCTYQVYVGAVGVAVLAILAHRVPGIG